MLIRIRQKGSHLRWRGEEFYRETWFMIPNVIAPAGLPVLTADESMGCELAAAGAVTSHT
jgi:hypothetical protein